MPLPPRLTHTLPDRRALSYSEFGDPAAEPVFYMHGWPASRLEAALLPNIPVRLIAVDRPGYGGSDPHDGRAIPDFADDVVSLADALGIATFRVAGISGGGAYALACAARHPGRVAAVAIVNAVPPPTAPGIGGDVDRLFRIGRASRAGAAALAAGRALLQSGLVGPRVVLNNGLCPADTACLTRPVLEGLRLAWREGTSTGIAGALSDARLYARDWGVPFAGITVPVAVWHGTADSIVPPATTAAFDALPRMLRNMVPDGGHYSVPLTRGNAILKQLTRL